MSTTETHTPWPAEVDPARWLLGACSSGDPLRAAVVAVCADVERLRAQLRTPRVWLDGDRVPAGTWVYVVDEDDPEERVYQLDAYEECGNGNLGPLVEIVLPDEETAVDLVTAEQIRRGRP